MAIAKTARFQINLVSVDLVKAAIDEFVTYVKEKEPGTLIYLSIQSEDEPVEFLHYMEFAGSAAEEIHQKSEAVNKFVDILYPLTVAGVEFHDYRLISTTRRNSSSGTSSNAPLTPTPALFTRTSTRPSVSKVLFAKRVN